MLEKFNDYLDQNNIRTEGERGVRDMKKVMTEVCGYDNNWSGTLENFFMDNSGAIEAVLEWIGTRRVSEWRDNLEDLVSDTEEV